MIKKLFVYLFLFLCLDARASEIDYGCKEKTLDVALYDLGILFSSKQNKGIDKDLVDLIKQKTKCHFNISTKPRARIWRELENGGTDITVSGISTEERKKFAYFINYLNAKNYALFGKKINAKNLKDFEKRSRRTFVGVVRSFKHGKLIDAFIDQMRTQNRVKDFPSSEDVFHALESGQIDLMFSLQLVFPYQKNGENFNVVDVDSEAVAHGLVLARRSFTAAQVENWNSLFLHLHQRKEIEKILGTYVKEPYLSETKFNNHASQ